MAKSRNCNSVSINNTFNPCRAPYNLEGAVIPSGSSGAELSIPYLPLGMGQKIDIAIDGVGDPVLGRCQVNSVPAAGYDWVSIYLARF